MTICVSVKVSEGLVLAADSTSVVEGIVTVNGTSTHGILKTFDHVHKVAQIQDYPVGTLTWGTALIGARSVESLIHEYAHTLVPLAKIDVTSARRRTGTTQTAKVRPERNVRQIAEGLRAFIVDAYSAEFAGRNPKPPLSVLVSGYSAGMFFPEQWLFEFPEGNELRQVRPDVDEKPSFGANWFGITDAITRLHWGRDDALLVDVAKHCNTSVEDIKNIMDRYQYPVFFDGMPLQDAVDYAAYLVNVVIGRFRFVVGAPLCGGAVEVAVVTPDGLTWIRRRTWELG
jgi:hypothetical protein